MEFTNVNVRVTTELLEAIDALAERESKATGLQVNRSDIVRRALTEDLRRRQEAGEKPAEGGAA